jgi:ankyrin repeat protein
MFDIAPEKCPFKKFDDDGRTLHASTHAATSHEAHRGGPPLNARAPTMPKKETLADYASSGDDAMCRSKIEQGADPNDPAQFRYNAPPLYWATTGHNEAARALLDGGADATWATPWDGSTALHRAATKDDLDNGNAIILRMLVEHNATLDAQTKDGQTALHYAANAGELETAKVLVDLGADAKIRSAEHGTAAECAERKGHAEIAALLRALPGVVAEEEEAAVIAAEKARIAALEAAAATTIQAVQRRRLASSLVEERVQEKLAEVTLLGELDKVKQLLSFAVWRPGAEVDAADDEGQTPLCLAAQAGHADIVRELLANGADDSLSSASGKTALDLASAGETDSHAIAAVR